MCLFDKIIVDKVANTCLEVFKKLPKTGKPVEKEWTVLSAIVQYDICNKNLDVVSLGTGTKCIGASKMLSSGTIINDSHAEVFARRGFLLYLYDNLDRAIESKPSIFEKKGKTYQLKNCIEFIFYSTQLPCGDASIMPKSDGDQFGDVLPKNKRKAGGEDNNEFISKKLKLESDIHRTGAKCLRHGAQDPKEDGINYHLVGQVRTKPGRDDTTLSVSCSDKIAKWIHLGIQGSLIDMLLCEPIYIKHFIFGAGVPYSEESVCRALLNRNEESDGTLRPITPQMHQSTVVFPHIRSNHNVRPSPCSILWSKMNDNNILEVAIRGRKLGVTKKTLDSPHSSLSVSKNNLYKRFISILEKDAELKELLCGEHNIAAVSYNEMKRKSKRYTDKWNLVKEKFFLTWTVKPDMWNFCVN